MGQKSTDKPYGGISRLTGVIVSIGLFTALFWLVDGVFYRFLLDGISFGLHFLAVVAVTGFASIIFMLALPTKTSGFLNGLGLGALAVFLMAFVLFAYGLYQASTGVGVLDRKRVFAQAIFFALILAVLSSISRRDQKAGNTKTQLLPKATKGKSPKQLSTAKPSTQINLTKLKSRFRIITVAIISNLCLSAILLAPGMYLLLTGQQGWGIGALFLGSFLLLLRTYRKPWRLTLLSSLLPVLCVCFCWGLQWVLFAADAPNLAWIGGAAGLGILFGLLRGRAHKIWQEDNAIFAKRTLGYLILWALAFGATQLFAFTSRDVLAFRAGLITGAFSTALLSAATLTLLLRRDKVRPRAIAAVMMIAITYGIISAPYQHSIAYAQSESAISRNVDSYYLNRGYQLGTPQECRRELGQATKNGKPCYCKAMLGLIPECEWPIHLEGQSEVPDKVGYFDEQLFSTLDTFSRWVAMRVLDTNLQISGNWIDTSNAYGRYVLAQACSGRVKTVSDQIENHCELAWEEVELSYSASAKKMAKKAVDQCDFQRDIGDYSFIEGSHSCQVVSIHSDNGLITKSLFDRAKQIARSKGDIIIYPAPWQNNTESRDISSQLTTVQRTSEEEVRTDPVFSIPEDTQDPQAWVNNLSEYFEGLRAGLGGQGESVTISEEKIITVTTAAAIALATAGVAASLVQAIAAAFAQAGTAVAEAGGQNLSETFEKSKSPTFTDPWGDSYAAEKDGTYWAPHAGPDGRYLSTEEMKAHITKLHTDEKDWQDNQAAWDKHNKKNAKWQQENRRKHQQKLANEHQMEAHDGDQKEYLKRLADGAFKRGDMKVYDRLMSDKMYNKDGTVNRKNLSEMDRIYRQRILDDVNYADVDEDNFDRAYDDGLLDWAADIDSRITPYKNSFLGRMGINIATGGMAEIVFQGHSLSEKMWKDEMAAMKAGQKTSFAQRLGSGATVIAEENLPVNTLKTAVQLVRGDKNVGLMDLGLNALSDFAAFADIKQAGQQGLTWRGYDDSVKDIKKSLNTLRGTSKSAKVFMTDPENFPGVGKIPNEDLFKAPDRFSSQEASAFMEAGLLSKNSQEHFDAVRREIKSGASPDELRDMVDAYHKGRQAGQLKVDNLKSARDNLNQARRSGADSEAVKQLERKFRDEVVRVQADKHAMNQMNQLPKINGENQYIKEFNTEIGQIYDEADARMIERLAKEHGVSPEDIQVVQITNMKGETGVKIDTNAPGREHYGHAKSGEKIVASQTPKGTNTLTNEAAEAAKAADAAKKVDPAKVTGKKVSFDRDMTVRKRVVDKHGNTHWVDIKAAETGKVYYEELYKSATGRLEAKAKTGDFANTHLNKNQSLADPLDIPPDQADEFAKKLDQATTDRLHAEAYGTGQADLDSATKDVFRGRDLTDSQAVANTVRFKVHHWLNEADDLKAMAQASRKEALELGVNTKAGQAKMQEVQKLLAHSGAAREEGARQLTKQYKNMGITRTESMRSLGNAPGATLPRELADDINILRKVETDPSFTIAEAEEVLRRKGTNVKEVSERLASYIEGQQKLRGGYQGQNLWMDTKSASLLAVNKMPTYVSTEQEGR